MARYELSNAAANDLLAIAQFGLERFGEHQALLYRDRLNQRFRNIAKHPERYPTVDHIRASYHRSVCGSHSIYYLVKPDHVLIVRVLGRQDARTQLLDS